MIDIRELTLAKQVIAEHVAVILFHRALVLQELNKAKLAAKDLARVKELGFEPGDDLF